MRFKDELLKNEYWEQTYYKLMQKPYLSVTEKNDIARCNEFDREEIVEQLISGRYEWSIPEKLELAKDGTSKKRVVYEYSLKDRFILGVIYRATSKLRVKEMCKHCFSYKSGVNTGCAIRYLREATKNRKLYGVKVDIHAYFNSVARWKVLEVTHEVFGECPGLEESIMKLVAINDVSFHGNNIQEYKGMIPGCSLGSMYANECLKHVDRHFEELGLIYARYSDDIIVFDENKENVERHIEYIKGELGKLDLELNPNKYVFFEPQEIVEYLGLKLNSDGLVDIADHGFMKMKRQVHRWCRKARIEIEREYVPFEVAARKVIRRLNNKNFKCLEHNEATFGWCIYAFQYITTEKTLKELDYYIRDSLRALKTGKHNKANVKALSDDDLKKLGWVSLKELYELYKFDYDYFREIVELL